MTVEELKKSNIFEFECNMDESFRDYEDHDEWGCAYAWFGDEIGVEYNFCVDNSTNEHINSCAIYKMEMNEETGYMETDTSVFEHYEIDFNNENWIEELEHAMCKVLIQFFELNKSLEANFEIRRADMKNFQEYSIWKHANEDIWEKCGEKFGKGEDTLVMVDVKKICEFDYKGEHFKVFSSSLNKNQFCREEFYEPIGEVAKVVYYRFTDKDFANVVMKEASGKTKEEGKMYRKVSLEEKISKAVERKNIARVNAGRKKSEKEL